MLLPTLGKCENDRVMKVGRNDPCACGSGKKYKKCCLSKDLVTRTAPPPAVEATEALEAPIEDDRQAAETPDDFDGEDAGSSAEEIERPPLQKYPRPEENLPELPPEQDRIIEAWWEATSPYYKKRDADQMIKQVETALTEFPSLFVHLGLHEEFLFELGGELGRRGRMADYVALLKRLRREQRQKYSFSYGAYDSDVIAELVISGQLEEIPAYLDLFAQYPDRQPDYCHEVCNLLAWRGLAEPLCLLCEAVATPMLTSSEVIGGNFALDWLIRREESLFFEGGDTSSEALERTADVIKRLGERIQYPLTPNADRLRAGLKACLEPPKDEQRGTLNDYARRRLGFNFAAYLRRTKGIPWVQGFLLSDLLQDYLFWCQREKLPWLRFQKKDMETFTVYRSKQFFSISGVTLLAVIQGLVWFAEYLGIAATISVSEAERIKQDCGQLFDAGRKALESTDPAYRICPTFEQLTAVSPS